MELNLGYKQTEAGVIPEEWQISYVGVEFDIKLGKMLDAEKNIGVPKLYLGNRAVQWGKIDISDLASVRLSHSDLSRFRLKKGDLLVCEGGEVGRAAIWEAPLPECYYQKALHRLRPIKKYDPLLMLYVLMYWSDRGKLTNYVTQTSIAHLTREKFEVVPLLLPPLPEQRAIAAALSDMDALLAAQDQLIAKKRDIKQAVMQQLLTGKQRLPGFSGEWEVKRLGEIGEIAGAGIDKKIRPNEVSVRLVNYLDVYRKDFITSQDLHHFVTATPIQASRCRVRKGDVFFTPSSEVRDDIAHSAVAMENIPDAVYSYHVIRLRPSDDWDLRFRAYAFKTKRFFDQAHMLCDGSGTRYVISQGKFRAMTVLVPPIPEQSSIAAVLSDIDAEIDALQQRRDKTKMLKQGMMQELLTGRTRLV